MELTKGVHPNGRRSEGAYTELQDIADEYGYKGYVKVRVADVIPIDPIAIDKSLYSFALCAHFDFLACDANYVPVFAVEFDGPYHQDPKQKQRDKNKDALCRLASFPRLRINDRHLLRRYNKASLLKWIISAWELQKAFEAAQEKGSIPSEEDFDPIFLWHQGKTIEEVHPHWIALKPRLHIEQLKKLGRIPQGHTNGLQFVDENENCRGIEWIDISDNTIVFVGSAMRSQNFPLHLWQLFTELITVILYGKLILFLKSGAGQSKPDEVEGRLDSLT